MIEIKNRKINDYSIESTLTAGLILVGQEIKSLIKKEVDITGSRCMIRGERSKREVFLVGSHFKVITSTFSTAYEATRDRGLLLKGNEIQYLDGEIQKNRVVIPVRIYKPDNSKKYKVELAICRPLKKWDKREKEKKRIFKREIEE